MKYNLDELPSDAELNRFLGAQSEYILARTAAFGTDHLGTLQTRALSLTEPYAGTALKDVHIDHVLAAAIGAFTWDGQPLRICHTESDGTLELSTRRDQRLFLEHWASEVKVVHDAIEVWRVETRYRARQIGGLEPILDDDGNALTGAALKRARAEVWNLHVADDWYGGSRLTWPYRERRMRNIMQELRAKSLPDDLADAKLEARDDLNALAESIAALFTDSDPEFTFAAGANSQQKTALALLESRRQAAMRAIRAATSRDAVVQAVTQQRALLNGVIVEDSPLWRTSNDGNLTDNSVEFRQKSPLPAALSFSVLVRNQGKEDRGPITVEPHGKLLNWTIATAPRAGSTKHGVDVTISPVDGFTAPTEEWASVFEIVAWNNVGPRSLSVTIVLNASDSE